jgi:diguanylate cyclase
VSHQVTNSRPANIQPVYVDAILKTRLLQILRITQIAIVIVALITFYLDRIYDGVVLLLTAIFLFSVNWAVNKNRSQLGIGILLLSLTAMLSYLAWHGSGIRDSAMIAYCGVLVYSAMLGTKRLLQSISSIMFFMCLFIAYANFSGLHVNTIKPISFSTSIIVIVILGVISFSVWLMAQDYRDALQKLAQENARVIEAKTQIEYLALHDPLTKLPNRIKAQKNFSLAFPNEQSQQVAVLFVDMDNLKPINDSLGHTIGDQILQEVARRLEAIGHSGHSVCRYGSDEFVVILPEINNDEEVASMSKRILAAISQPFLTTNMEINCTCSIGIALAPRDGENLDTLIKKADIAMYHSKESGRNGFHFFHDNGNQNLLEHLNLVSSMRKAVAENQFSLYYQPKLDLHSLKINGFEALLRWQHPQYGFIPPATFIPLAESSGVIIQLGEWVLNEACRQGKTWMDAGFSPFSIAVNISSIQFKRGNLEAIVTQALRKSGLPPHMLELELTESVLIEDSERLSTTLANLRNVGVHFSIDDFGTGYSNLGYLKKFQVEYLKIDQSFIRRMEDHPDDAVIVKAIIQLAKSLGLETIAEGVETESVAQLLRMMGCQNAQGYLWSRPLPANSAEALWRSWKGKEA